MATSNSEPHTPTPPGIRDHSRRTLSNPKIKDKVFIEKYGAETNGEYTLIRCTVSPGGGTPLHYHGSYQEQLTAKEGILGVVVGEETKTFQPGETAVVEIGTKHRFFNPSADKDIEFVGKVVPAHEGFEQSIYIMYGWAEDGLCDENALPKSFVHLCLMADLGDMRWPGIMSVLGNPLIKSVAAYGRWSGEEDRLLKKYWY
jgi:mannose-6-phosphate isomerase-like protein (cupin superfamily)